MRTEIARLDLSLRRRSVIGYSLGMAVYMLVVVALYPAFKDSTSLDKFVQTTPRSRRSSASPARSRRRAAG